MRNACRRPRSRALLHLLPSLSLAALAACAPVSPGARASRIEALEDAIGGPKATARALVSSELAGLARGGMRDHPARA